MIARDILSFATLLAAGIVLVGWAQLLGAI